MADNQENDNNQYNNQFLRRNHRIASPIIGNPTPQQLKITPQLKEGDPLFFLHNQQK